MSTKSFYLVWRLNYFLTEDRSVLIRMLIPISIYLQCASANYSALKSWTRPFSSKSPCRTDWVTRGGGQNLVLVNNNVNTPAITKTLSLSAPELSLPSARSSKMSPAWWDDLYCAKLLRLCDRAERSVSSSLAVGSALAGRWRIFMFNLNNWDLSWCVACVGVRSWHFIIWISALLDTINYQSCVMRPQLRPEIYDNQPVFLKTETCYWQTFPQGTDN